MANPRRSSYTTTIDIPSSQPPSPSSTQRSNYYSTFSSSPFVHFLKKPHAFPFLLSLFLFLTWVSLRLHQHSSASRFSSPPHLRTNSDNPNPGSHKSSKDDDFLANLVRFSSGFPSKIAKDNRGWLVNPVSLALDLGIRGGAVTCASIHVGEIRPGGVRGNHRHHTCNETFVIWGAQTKFRLENPKVGGKGYGEVVIGADEVAVAASPSGTAHVIVNMDSVHSTYFLGCQDSIIDYNNSRNDFNVWKDL